MQLDRFPHSPAELIAFYEESLTRLGALCERTWHDRLQVIAEGPAARPWNAEGKLHEIELCFPALDASSARDAARDVFPGCPLTFKLADLLRPEPLVLERFVLPVPLGQPPDAALAEKRWRADAPAITRFQLGGSFTAGWHFSLLAMVRCEIQAIDQHWHLFRVALSLPDGAPDADLARELPFYLDAPPAQVPGDLAWPALDSPACREFLMPAAGRLVQPALEKIRSRQEQSLRRELERIDDYFTAYREELKSRVQRTRAESAQAKVSDRLAAAQAEHQRRRDDQVNRHEIRVIPHIDSLVLLAEPAWENTVRLTRGRDSETVAARYLPRTRRWAAG